MILKIGVLCQDRNSYGFLEGLKRRLKCHAELIEPASGNFSKSTMMSSKQARLATLDMARFGVGLIVRFTDADANPWQDIKRHEVKVFPDSSKALVVCGVAVENVEQWLAFDTAYLASQLGLSLDQVSAEDCTEVIKSAITKLRRSDEPASEVTARIVECAPSDEFQRWLKSDAALADFYQECRSAALRADCDVPNELEN